jgi:hypothetical protein
MTDRVPERGLKARLLREAIARHPDLSPTALAEHLNQEHADTGLAFKPQDVSNSRQQEKSARSASRPQRPAATPPTQKAPPHGGDPEDSRSLGTG